ncbi:MAG: chromate efflux transporter [Desulfuromonadales bacterium]|nr:chromate efflux transporter [Desulfuromonadales bacterium]MBN2791477.1 chromate efflux transporter [Desulfuromonadales bacterium]
MQSTPQQNSPLQIFRVFLRLGLTSFGGPIAHLGYFHHEFVVRRRWLKEEAYADLVALCQFLPGPASSQVGIGIGLSQAGLRGGIAAWCGFTLPSAVVLILFAYGVGLFASESVNGFLAGLKIAAVAVVAHAVLGMAQKLCTDTPRRLVAVIATLLALLVSGLSGQLLALLFAAFCGWFFISGERAGAAGEHEMRFQGSRTQAKLSGLLFVILLFGLPLAVGDRHYLQLFDGFFRSGALVFGGGHVVLPLLQAEVVGHGWLDKELFVAGYGAAQAVPGPLFTFSAYLGAAMETGVARWISGLICLTAIFLPSFLLLIGILPHWERLRLNTTVRRILSGVNAGMVGLLTAAFFTPVFTSGIHGISHLLLAGFSFWMLKFKAMPSWSVVLVCGIAGLVLY